MSALLRGLRRLLLACVLGWLGSSGAAFASSCGPAAEKGSAPADFRDYCWLDFAGYDDALARNGGQLFTFDLPDGTKVTMTVSTTGGNLTAVAVPSWTGSAFGNSAFKGIPGQPILYTRDDGDDPTVTLSNITVTPPSGGTSQYSIVVADGESTNNGETLAFTTWGSSQWTSIATIPNGTGYPSVAYSTASTGTGNNRVTTYTVKETGVAGTVGSYVFRSDGNPKQISAAMVASGLQGIIVGMRYASISVVSEFAGARYNPTDQFTYGLATTAGKTLVTQTSSGTALNGFDVAAMPTVAASYSFDVSQKMAAGSGGTLANYTTSLTCVNAKSGGTTTMPVNKASSTHTFTNLAYGDSVLCTFTNTPIFNQIVGTVYADANHNSVQDGGEAGPGSGVSAYVKVTPVTNGACTGPATQAIAVNATTGAYTIPSLAQANYCVILDNNATLSDITPNPPAGWLGTQNAGGILQVSVPAGSPTPPPQVFGLYKGSRLTGTVFTDTGVGSGTPNNGAKDGTEPGLDGIAVTAKSGTSTIATATTGGDGAFTLWVPSTVATALAIAPALPTGSLATGGSAGTTGGTFSRPTVTYTPVAGQSYTGVAFGVASPSTLVPSGAQTAQPGSVVFYAHTFEAGSGGQVTFSLANASVPASPAWSTVLYRDASCNAGLEGSEPLVSAAITVEAGKPICLVVKQFVPAAAPYGAQNVATLTATFTYTNANPALSATLKVTDTTTSGEPTALNLKKVVRNVTRSGPTGISATAMPGDVLLYTLTAQNNGSGPLTELVINDATPAFTTFVNATCPGSLPATVTACAVSTKPAVGAEGGVQWTFGGSLAGGAQLEVTYQVKLSQ